MSMLHVEALNVWFGKSRDRVDAVKSATFDVAVGESFGLVGESGSGKSTILRAITGLATEWSGTISVNNEALTKKRPRAFFKTVQMVFQDPYASLHPRHSVDQVLGETLHLHGFKDIDARVTKLLDDVGLGQKFRFRYPHQLSGGQRQRVAIARTLAADPDILLMDEPFGALDALTREHLQNQLLQINRTERKTTIFVTHDVEEAILLAHRIIVFSARPARILEDIDVAAVLPVAERDQQVRDLSAFLARRRRIQDLLRAEQTRAESEAANAL